MDRKVLILVIGALLAVLFLSTVGSFYTGYAVLGQSRPTLQDYPYPFIKNNVPNSLYIVIPYNADYQEYSAATVIAKSLKEINPIPPQIVADKELPEGQHNLILIGTPCDNELIARELNTNKCNANLRPGEGLLKLINKDRTSVLIVSGHSSDDISKSSLVLSYYKFYPLRGSEIKIAGKIGSLTLYYH